MENILYSDSLNHYVFLNVKKSLPLTIVPKERLNSKPKDSDDVSINTASIEANSDIESDLNGIEVKKLSQDDIEIEILPLKI